MPMTDGVLSMSHGKPRRNAKALPTITASTGLSFRICLSETTNEAKQIPEMPAKIFPRLLPTLIPEDDFFTDS